MADPLILNLRKISGLHCHMHYLSSSFHFANKNFRSTNKRKYLVPEQLPALRPASCPPLCRETTLMIISSSQDNSNPSKNKLKERKGPTTKQVWMW